MPTELSETARKIQEMLTRAPGASAYWYVDPSARNYDPMHASMDHQYAAERERQYLIEQALSKLGVVPRSQNDHPQL